MQEDAAPEAEPAAEHASAKDADEADFCIIHEHDFAVGDDEGDAEEPPPGAPRGSLEESQEDNGDDDQNDEEPNLSLPSDDND